MNEQLYNTQRDKTVVILGYTCSGKTTLCKRLFESNDGDYNLAQPYHIIHTDDYIGTYGWDASLYKIMEDEEHIYNSHIVIEGVQGYRLLRKWAQTGRGAADLVITCVAPKEVRAERYAARNNGKELPRGFDQMLSKIWMDWRELDRDYDSNTRCVQYDTVLNKIVE